MVTIPDGAIAIAAGQGTEAAKTNEETQLTITQNFIVVSFSSVLTDVIYVFILNYPS